jgi:catechol 2,3-dioxygenase-like lactoylglutathione lyase family enzyme
MAVKRGAAAGAPPRSAPRSAANRIAGVSLTSADADALAGFYEALGFTRGGVELRGGPAFARLTGLPGAEARVILLRLGRERLELVSFAQPGQPYPRERASNDPWFQHFAIVVASMEAAYARLRDCAGWTPITRSAPQRLPERSGGVAAFKFRDPEGHPLELLEFPRDHLPPVWGARLDERRQRGPAPFLGIDHSAIVVASSSRSIEFYARLGFARAGGSFNQGTEQAALDDLSRPEVEVTALAPPAPPPHLELLCYRAPPAREAARTASEPPAPERPSRLVSPPAPLASNDIAATRLLLEVDGAPEADITAGTVIHDPDGHALVLTHPA